MKVWFTNFNYAALSIYTLFLLLYTPDTLFYST